MSCGPWCFSFLLALDSVGAPGFLLVVREAGLFLLQMLFEARFSGMECLFQWDERGDMVGMGGQV